VTVAGFVISIITVSLAAGQGPLFVEVNVKITDPVLMSAAVIPYCAFKLVLEGLNPPVPELVQLPVVPPPPIVPASPSVEVLEHKDWFGPAFAVEGTLIFIITVSLTGAQAPLLVDVNVKITVPEAISAGVIAYDVFKKVIPGLNPPVPLLVQKPVLEELNTEPVRFIDPAVEHRN
jgi:hypothetical protein